MPQVRPREDTRDTRPVRRGEEDRIPSSVLRGQSLHLPGDIPEDVSPGTRPRRVLSSGETVMEPVVIQTRDVEGRSVVAVVLTSGDLVKTPILSRTQPEKEEFEFHLDQFHLVLLPARGRVGASRTMRPVT